MLSHTKRFQNGVYFSAWRSARYWELFFAYLLLFCVQTNFVEWLKENWWERQPITTLLHVE